MQELKAKLANVIEEVDVERSVYQKQLSDLSNEFVQFKEESVATVQAKELVSFSNFHAFFQFSMNRFWAAHLFLCSQISNVQ